MAWLLIPMCFQISLIVGNGDSSLQELQNNVLDCLNETIHSLDKSMFQVSGEFIQYNMCSCTCLIPQRGARLPIKSRKYAKCDTKEAFLLLEY